MKNFLLTLLAMLLLATSQGLYSQKKAVKSSDLNEDKRTGRCLSDEYNEYLMKTYPKMNSIEEIKARASSNLRLAGENEVIRIPVVVHVIHNGEAIGVGPNISDAQVISQIQVLNEDYRRQSGTNGFNTHPDGADTNIEFYLAREDPNCNPTNGIDRVDMSDFSTTWSGPGGNTESVLKPMTIWDTSRYLNIWTVTFSDSNNLGYAQFPGGPEETDGVVIAYDIFGTDEAPGVTITDPSYYLGRTTTHEVGHFFGLYHTFNTLSCTGNGDFVDDTPPTNQQNFGCPDPVPDSCPADSEDDMIENYMDYSDDICFNVFTNGQTQVMRGYLEDPNFRLSLANSTVADKALPDVTYDGSIAISSLNDDGCSGVIRPELILANYGTTTLTNATISYSINSLSTETFNWSGSLNQGEEEEILLPTLNSPTGSNQLLVSVEISNSDERVCNDSDTVAYTTESSFVETTQVYLTLTTDDYAEETSWEFRNGNGDLIASDSYNAGVDDNKTFNETFDVSNEDCYSFIIFDSQGDGLCCGFGNGSYELRADDDTLIYAGGEFNSVETTNISTLTLSIEEPSIFEGVKIYPNPTSSILHIVISNQTLALDKIEVYNLFGQLMLTRSVRGTDNMSINTSAFQSGMYILRLSKDNSVKSIPFIKN